MNLQKTYISLLLTVLVGFMGYAFFQRQNASQSISPVVERIDKSDNAIAGIFEGRTPCGDSILAINTIPAAGCERIKIRLTLNKDPKTFQLLMVYVGKGDTQYIDTGTWIVTKGTKADPSAIVYQLTFDKGKSPISLFKADDNLLLLLDENMNLLVGDAVESYTLNRTES